MMPAAAVLSDERPQINSIYAKTAQEINLAAVFGLRV